MRAMTILTPLLLLAVMAAPAIADGSIFTGTFSGTGRACSGGVHIRVKTIEWNSSFSVCKLTEYQILEKDFSSAHRRIVYRLKTRSRRCRYDVIEVDHVGEAAWNVNGYQSMEAYKNREAADWKNSPLPERQVLSCPMIGPN